MKEYYFYLLITLLTATGILLCRAHTPFKKYMFFFVTASLLLLLPVLHNKAIGQTATTFMRTFQATGMNGGLSLAETSDGGFIGTGQHEYTGTQSCDIYVYKVNGCGYPQWFKTYGGVGEDGGKQVLQTSDGGYIVSALSHAGAGGYDMTLLKLDASGAVQWSKVFGAASDDYGLYAHETSDKGYVFTGFATGAGFGGADVSLIKTDSLGNLQWMKLFGGAGEDWGDYVEETSDGSFIVTGYTTSFGAGGYDIYLLKISSTGNLQWSKTYGGPGGDGSSSWGISGKITQDKGIMLCANTTSWGAGNNDVLLIKADSLGNLLWAKTYGGISEEQPRFADETPDKGFIISGYTTSFGAGDADAYLVKTDSLGNLQWSKAYGGAAFDKAVMVRKTPDNGYALSTITSSFGAVYFDPIFMKTDSLGNVGCYEANCATIVNNVTPTLGSGANQMVAPFTVGNPSLPINNYTPSDNFICLNCGIVPTFTQSTTTACIGNTVYYYNTTNPGNECTEWFVNNVPYGVQDTMAIVFTTPGVQKIQLVASCGNSTDTNTVSLNILAYNAPVASFTNNIVCNSDSTRFIENSTSSSGSINAWSWDYGNSTPPDTLSDPVYVYPNPGTYSVVLTITTTDGCTDTAMRTVIVHPLPVVQFDSVIVCKGDTVQFNNLTTILNTDAIQSWNWNFGDGSPPDTTYNPFHVFPSPGSYNVKLIAGSNNGCSDSLVKTITVTPPFTIDAAFGASSVCTGGTILLGGAPTASGGLPPYTYNWLPATGLSNASVANPTATITSSVTYTLSVTSADGCVLTDTVQVIYNAGSTHAEAGFGNSSLCTGGIILLGGNPTGSGGTGPYTYKWLPSAGLSDSTASNPTAAITSNATYVLTVTDSLGCQDMDSVTVLFSSIGPYADAGFGNNSLCTGGTVLLGGNPTGTGGIGAYTYSWLPAAGISDTSGSNPTATVTASTTYAVIVTDSTGCQNIDSVHIVFSATGPYADAGFGNNTLCTGGTILLGGAPTATGGVSPYSYSWTTTTGLSDSITANPTATISANTLYVLTVRDSLNCQNIDTVNLIYNSSGPHSEAGFGSDSMCTGGIILLGGAPTANGGTPPYLYSWSPSINLSDSLAANPTATLTNNTGYVLTVTDSAGCQDVDSVFILYSSIGPYADAGFGNASLCTGGTILTGGSPTGTGGQFPYTYSWLPVTGLNNSTAPNPTASITSNTTYAVIVTDNLNCQNIDSIHLIFNASGPHAEAGFGADSVCTGGTILLGGAPTAAGGTAPYTYFWTPPGNLSSISLANPTATITSNANYVITVTDNNNCQDMDSVFVLFSANGPYAEASAGSNSLCTSGTILIGGSPTAFGGISPYTYSWLPATGLNNSLSANPVAVVTADITYAVIVADAQGCQNTDTVHITYNASAVEASSGYSNSSPCTGGTILLGGSPAASSGTLPYTYLWIPAAGLNSSSLANPTATITSNVTYILVVTDGNGCQDIDSANLVFTSSGPYSDAGAGDGSLCFSSNIVLGGNPTGNGGVPPYIYTWIPALGLNSPGASNPTAVAVTTNTVYYLTVTDAAGCTSVDSAVVVIIGTGVTADFTAAPVFGYEELNVTFNNLSAGSGLSYSWDFGDGATSTEINPNHSFSNQSDTANHYTVTLISTDIYGCSDTAVFDSLVNLEASSDQTGTNIFTPNGDGINDNFSFNFRNMEFLNVAIFNRWGQKVFGSETPNSVWDGRSASGVPVADGVYYYMLKGKGLDGKKHEKTGYIQLMR